jgi:hypothetical protein
MKNFYKAFVEALNLGGKPDIINPEIKRDIESGGEEIVGAVPSQEYLELIVSDSYRQLVDRVVHYTGIPENQITTRNMPSLLGQAFAALRRIKEIESRDARFFENLALDVVLEFPEFKYVKQAYESDMISFDISLGHGELENAITEPKQEEEPQEDNIEQLIHQADQEAAEEQPENEEATPTEEEEFDLASELMDDTEKKLRRRLANALMQGNATNKFYLFNMVAERLNERDPSLVNLYGLTTSIPQLAYYFMPKGSEEQMLDGGGQDFIAGSEEVSKEKGEDKVKIKVRGQTFPLLIHEIVKGIYEYLSITKATKNAAETQDTVGKERMDVITGAPLWKKLAEMIPDDAQELIPRIYQDVINHHDIEEIKHILAGDDIGRRVMGEIIADIKEEMGPDEDEEETYKDSE